MTVTYRNSTAADAPMLRQLFADVFVETFGALYRPADLQQFLDENSLARWEDNLANPKAAIRIAEADGEPVGFAEVAPKTLPYETSAPAAELRRLYLKSSAQGRGIADELMRWALGEARKRGAEELILSVYVDNYRARRFYDRFGFEPVGRYDFMVGSHADEDVILRHVILQAPA